MKFPAMLARTLLAVFPMPDRLIERTLRAFSDELSSDAPVPGGGSAAAYAGAMGAALAAMVARIAARKNGSDELRAFVEEVDNLRADFLRLVDDDSAAYARVAEAMKLPRRTEEEKRARQERLQAALLAASRVPLEVAKTSRRLLEACERGIARSSPMTASDIGVGALMAEGGTFTFDSSAHAASVLVTGVGGLSLTPSPNYSGGCLAAPIHVAETTPTACTASYSFAGDGDHLGSSDSAAIVINKAASTTKVTGGTFTFDGSAHAASVLVTGAGSLSLTPSPSYSGGCSAAPIHVAQTTPTACTASYSFAGDGDHTGSNDSATIVITPAASLTKVTGGTFPFDGSAHAAGVLVTGAGSLSRTPPPSYSGACSAAPIHVAQTPCTARTASSGYPGP